MGSLSQEQIDQIAQDLRAQGITFDPLRTELLDHLICDIEIQMGNGKDFETALLNVKNQIPENHFKDIQTETMELLNKKINPVHALGFISFALLTVATLFKMLHLPGAGILLLAFLMAVSLTLLIGSARSVYIYRESQGRGLIILVAILLVSFIIGLCFKILHLPGASVLLYFSVIALCILFPALSVYFYTSKQKRRKSLLIRIIRDNQTILEYTALTLIGFGLIFNYSSLLIGVENFVGIIFFIFAVTLTGMYVYTLTWKHYVDSHEPSRLSNILLLIFSSLAFIMFMLPVVGELLNPVLRHYFAYLPGTIFCLVAISHYLRISESRHKLALAALSFLLAFYPLLRLGTKLEWFEGFPGGLTTSHSFTIGFLIFLMVLLFTFRKERLFKALIILLTASHMIPNL